MRSLRFLLIFGFLLGLWNVSLAQKGVITLDAYPSTSVADGRSTLTITAQIRDDHGNLVPNGTQVIFDTNLGTFRDKVVKTENGYARAVLIAGNTPGIAKIRASVLRFNAIMETDVEFVADRSLLSSARDYFEISGTETLVYAVQDKVFEATGVNKGAVFKYRDITIRADDMQVRVPAYEVRARRAILEYRGQEYPFDELYFIANRKTGYGVGTMQRMVADPENKNHSIFPVKFEPYYGALEINSRGVVPATRKIDSRNFDYANVAESISRVEAKEAVAFPRKEVQFHSANVILTGQSIMKVPLYKLPVNTYSPIVTDQIINVSNNDVAVDYPYYVGLRPGDTQLFRFKWGNRYATGTGASSGALLSYEWAWNRGDEMDGGFNVVGIGRNDWGANFRQSWMFDPGSILSFQLDAPAHRSLYATSNYSKRLGNLNMNLNGTQGLSLSGTSVRSNSLNMVLETDPIKQRSLGANLILGINATQAQLISPGATSFRQGAGVQARLVSRTTRFGPGTSLNWSYQVAQLSGHNVPAGLTQLGTLSIGMQPAPALSTNITYNFTEDGFTAPVLGRHALTMDMFYNPGRLSISGSISKALDVDRMNASSRLRLSMAKLWNVYYSYSYDQFGPDSFLDQSIILSYKLGFREIGLSYSQRTKRLGIEILGTSFN